MDEELFYKKYKDPRISEISINSNGSQKENIFCQGSENGFIQEETETLSKLLNNSQKETIAQALQSCDYNTIILSKIISEKNAAKSLVSNRCNSSFSNDCVVKHPRMNRHVIRNIKNGNKLPTDKNSLFINEKCDSDMQCSTESRNLDDISNKTLCDFPDSCLSNRQSCLKRKLECNDKNGSNLKVDYRNKESSKSASFLKNSDNIISYSKHFKSNDSVDISENRIDNFSFPSKFIKGIDSVETYYNFRQMKNIEIQSSPIRIRVATHFGEDSIEYVDPTMEVELDSAESDPDEPDQEAQNSVDNPEANQASDLNAGSSSQNAVNLVEESESNLEEDDSEKHQEKESSQSVKEPHPDEPQELTINQNMASTDNTTECSKQKMPENVEGKDSENTSKPESSSSDISKGISKADNLDSLKQSADYKIQADDNALNMINGVEQCSKPVDDEQKNDEQNQENEESGSVDEIGSSTEYKKEKSSEENNVKSLGEKEIFIDNKFDKENDVEESLEEKGIDKDLQDDVLNIDDNKEEKRETTEDNEDVKANEEDEEESVVVQKSLTEDVECTIQESDNDVSKREKPADAESVKASEKESFVEQNETAEDLEISTIHINDDSIEEKEMPADVENVETSKDETGAEQNEMSEGLDIKVGVKEVEEKHTSDAPENVKESEDETVIEQEETVENIEKETTNASDIEVEEKETPDDLESAKTSGEDETVVEKKEIIEAIEKETINECSNKGEVKATEDESVADKEIVEATEGETTNECNNEEEEEKETSDDSGQVKASEDESVVEQKEIVKDTEEEATNVSANDVEEKEDTDVVEQKETVEVIEDETLNECNNEEEEKTTENEGVVEQTEIVENIEREDTNVSNNEIENETPGDSESAKASEGETVVEQKEIVEDIEGETKNACSNEGEERETPDDPGQIKASLDESAVEQKEIVEAIEGETTNVSDNEVEEKENPEDTESAKASEDESAEQKEVDKNIDGDKTNMDNDDEEIKETAEEAECANANEEGNVEHAEISEALDRDTKNLDDNEEEKNIMEESESIKASEILSEEKDENLEGDTADVSGYIQETEISENAEYAEYVKANEDATKEHKLTADDVQENGRKQELSENKDANENTINNVTDNNHISSIDVTSKEFKDQNALQTDNAKVDNEQLNKLDTLHDDEEIDIEDIGNETAVDSEKSDNEAEGSFESKDAEEKETNEDAKNVEVSFRDSIKGKVRNEVKEIELEPIYEATEAENNCTDKKKTSEKVSEIEEIQKDETESYENSLQQSVDNEDDSLEKDSIGDEDNIQIPEDDKYEMETKEIKEIVDDVYSDDMVTDETSKKDEESKEKCEAFDKDKETPLNEDELATQEELENVELNLQNKETIGPDEDIIELVDPHDEENILSDSERAENCESDDKAPAPEVPEKEIVHETSGEELLNEGKSPESAVTEISNDHQEILQDKTIKREDIKAAEIGTDDANATVVDEKVGLPSEAAQDSIEADLTNENPCEEEKLTKCVLSLDETTKGDLKQSISNKDEEKMTRSFEKQKFDKSDQQTTSESTRVISPRKGIKVEEDEIETAISSVMFYEEMSDGNEQIIKATSTESSKQIVDTEDDPSEKASILGESSNFKADAASSELASAKFKEENLQLPIAGEAEQEGKDGAKTQIVSPKKRRKKRKTTRSRSAQKDGVSSATKRTQESKGSASKDGLRTSRSVSSTSARSPSVGEKKIPPIKAPVGTTPPPKIKQAKSKIGSLDNVTHRPKGGEKKVESVKLEWNAKSKVGSLDYASHKPGGGDKKILTQKVDFKNVQSKVGSKDNIKHKPGGGNLKISNEKVDFKAKAASKVGSLDNAKHKPGGGNVAIKSEKLHFKDKAASKIHSRSGSERGSSHGGSETQSPVMPSSPAPPEGMPPLNEDEPSSQEEVKPEKAECNGGGESAQDPSSTDASPTKSPEKTDDGTGDQLIAF